MMDFVKLEVKYPAPEGMAIPAIDGCHFDLGPNGPEMRIQLHQAQASERRELRRVSALGLYVASMPAPIAFPVIRFGSGEWWMDATFDARQANPGHVRRWLEERNNGLIVTAFDGREVLCNHLVGMPPDLIEQLAKATAEMLTTDYTPQQASLAIVNVQSQPPAWLIRQAKVWPIR